MNTQTVQAHSMRYLKLMKSIDRKKIRSLRRLWHQTTENVYEADTMATLFRMRSQGFSIAKLLRKFYKYNEREKTEILSLHAVLEKYFVGIETRNAEFVGKRLVLNARLDQLIQIIISGEETRKKSRKARIEHVVRQLSERFDLEKSMILLLAVHSILKKRLVDIEANSDEFIGCRFELSARLTELARYKGDELDCAKDISD